MSTARELATAVRDAWSDIPAPPPEEVEYFEWGWGPEAARAFVGVAPVDVDRRSEGFRAATPLLDLPAPAAAAYLGTFVMALLESLDHQERAGLPDDFLARAHTITALTLPDFWERVIRPCLPERCRDVLADVAAFLATPPERELLLLTDEQAAALLELSTFRRAR
jgi:hypothetical protein